MDPGGHNRDAQIWDTESGHYGHCHVPENTHWDPGYSPAEFDFIVHAVFDTDGRLVSPEPPPASRRHGKGRRRTPKSTMPDHAIVAAGALIP